jgi:hypothetical protein
MRVVGQMALNILKHVTTCMLETPRGAVAGLVAGGKYFQTIANLL